MLTSVIVAAHLYCEIIQQQAICLGGGEIFGILAAFGGYSHKMATTLDLANHNLN